ncbi:MAG: hypothetical protein ABI972_14865 [Acidobacteriota bacterium]
MASALPLPTPARASHHISLDIGDPEVVHELLQRAEGAERDDYLRLALRIGVLSLRLAGGQVDEKKLRDEGDRLVRDVQREIEDYLHPEKGRLRASLSQFVEGDRSILAQTIAAKIGESSPIFKILDPRNSEGLKSQLSATVKEIVDAHARGITGQLSLDEPSSALSRLKRTLDGQVETIHKNQSEFHTEVREALAGLQATRKANERGTVHGLEFEDALCATVSSLAQGHADVAEPSGNSTGLIKNCKTGDIVVTLGPDSPAPGVKIVWEAKQAGGYTLRSALDEINEARKNREAQIGIFVFSARHAPATLEPFGRYDRDIVIVWDAEDPNSALLVRAAYSLARALALREKKSSADSAAALRSIDEATRAVARQASYLDEMRTWAETVKRNGEKIADRATRMTTDLQRAIDTLDAQLITLRSSE